MPVQSSPVRQRWKKLLTKLSAFTRPSRLMGLTKAPLSRVGAKEALERTAFEMDEEGLKALAVVSVRTRIPVENFMLDDLFLKWKMNLKSVQDAK